MEQQQLKNGLGVLLFIPSCLVSCGLHQQLLEHPQTMTPSCGSLATVRPDATALFKSDVVQMQTRQLWAVKLQMMGIRPAWAQDLQMKKEGGSSVATPWDFCRVTSALGVKAGLCP